MAKVSLQIDKRPNAAGLYPVRIRISQKTLSAYVSTDIRVQLSQWDAESGMVVNHPVKAAINNFLKSELLKFENALLELTLSRKLNRMSASEIKDYVVNPEKESRKYNVRDFMVSIMEKKHGETRNVFLFAIRKFDAICPGFKELSFDDVNKSWAIDMVDKMRKTGVKDSTIREYFSKISEAFKLAIEEGLARKFPFYKIGIKPEKTKKRSLTVEQLRAVFFSELPGKKPLYRDIFMLSFLLVGINTSDLLKLKEIVNGRIEYSRSKTKRLYSIKVEPEAMEIMNRYKGSERLLSFAENAVRAHTVNLGLKYVFSRISQIVDGVPEGVTSYWARHSWATIAASLDIPKETISAALGHEIGSSITSIYINFDEKKIDEANRKVIDFVFYGKR